MGEHSTWFDFLNGFEGWRNLQTTLKHHLGRGMDDPHHWELAMFGQDSHFELTHVLMAGLVVAFLICGGFAYRGALARAGKDAIVPPATFNLRNLFELFLDGVLGIMEGVMGKQLAREFLPVIAPFSLFIFFSNLLALIPGFAPPTATLKTNLALSGLIFLATHFYGLKKNGIGYLKHFLGPVWWLAPLMLPIELISHLARPISLALRLMGNMAADHKVVFAFFTLVPFLVPVPFLVLGVMVVVIQTLVFSLLSMVYISMAIAHEEHH